MEIDHAKAWKTCGIMDPINIIVALNLIATFGANMSGAKKGFRASITAYKEKPITYLQTIPVYFSVITLILLIIGIFQVGTFAYKPAYTNIRITGFILYLTFSWIQVWSFKTLGESYSQQILIFKNHNLITSGPYKFIRHPQYISQFVIDICGGIAVMSYLLVPLAVIELPFLLLRASFEDQLLAKHFKDSFEAYRKKSGFVIPFIG